MLQGELIDTDSYMRLVRIDYLHQTGAWFDSNIPRSNAPYGDVLHWTRPLDILILAGTWLLTPFMEFEPALFWSGALLSPLLMLVTAFVLAWAGKPLIERELRPLVMLAFLAQVAVLAYSFPGRVDHHALLFLIFALSIGFGLRLAMGSLGLRAAVLAGAIAGAGMWVSVEFLLAVVAILSVLWLAWVKEGAARTPPIVAYACGLSAMVLLALVIERPIPGLFAEEYDRLSLVYLLVVSINLGFWVVVLMGRKAVSGFSRPMGRPMGRLIYSILGAAVGGALIFAIYPKFFGGPMVDMDPAYSALWEGKINELRSILPTDTQTLAQFLVFLGSALIALPVVVWRLWITRRDAIWMEWALLAVMLGLYTGLAILHVRFASFAEIIAVVPLIFIIGRLRQWLACVNSELLRDLVRGTVTSVLIMGFAIAGQMLGFGATAQTAVQQAATNKSEPCVIKDVASVLNDPTGMGARPHIIVALIDYGPELLYRTQHSVLGTPYHRNYRGTMDTYRLLSARNEAESKRIIDARGIDLILLCRSPVERNFYQVKAGDTSLYSRLIDAGRIPDWMRSVDLPAGLEGFRLYQVSR